MPQVTGPLTTTAPSDVFGTHDSKYGIGGYREVADHAARDAITDERRRAMMLVGTQNDGLIWKLKEGPWSHTSADWEEFAGGEGGAPDSQEFEFPTPVNQWVMNHSLGGYPLVQTMELDRNPFEVDPVYTSTSEVVITFPPGRLVAGYAILRNSG